LKRIAELVVHVANLVEAEGRALRDVLDSRAADTRRYISRIGTALVLLLCSLVFVLAGATLLTRSAFGLIEQHWGSVAAFACTGLGLLVIGIICMRIFQSKAKA